jgi:E3 ubiquitin-protein ligase BRE1
LIKTNSRLIKQSAEKDEMNAKSLSTILHLKSLTEKLALEKDLLEQQVKSSGQLNLAARLASHAREKLVDEMFNKEKEFDNKISLLESECEKIKENYEMTIGHLDMKKAELSIIEKDASTAKQRCDELVSELMLQEVEKRKILETLAVAQRDASESAKIVAQLRTQKFGEDSTSIFTTDQLTTQISVLKGRLSCPVCNHRDKSCIILRCRHMFCKHCLDESIKNRNRKCPSCGQRFDTKDVEDIWL